MSKVEKFSGLLIFLVAAILVLVIIPRSSYSATYRYIPNTVFHWDDPYTGEPLAGGKVYFYAAATTDATTVWKDYEGATAHPNPVILDAYGNAQIFGDKRGYKIVVKDSNDVQLESIDGITLFDETSTYASDLIAADDAAAARAVLGLGNSVILDASNGALDLVQLDSDGKLPGVNASKLIALPTAFVPLPRSYLSGFNLSTSGLDDISISAGSCRDVNDATNMYTTSALVKQLDAVWAEGTGAGGRVGSAAASTWYHVYAIASATRTDVMFNATAPSAMNASTDLPTGYTHYRRIGSIVTSATVADIDIEPFHQFRDTFYWDKPKPDEYPTGINTPNLNASDTTFTLDYVPTGVVTEAIFNAQLRYDGENDTVSVYFYPPSLTSMAPNNIVYSYANFITADSIGASIFYTNNGGAVNVGRVMRVFTNTSAAIHARSHTAGLYMYLYTLGWVDDRGRSD